MRCDAVLCSPSVPVPVHAFIVALILAHAAGFAAREFELDLGS